MMQVPDNIKRAIIWGGHYYKQAIAASDEIRDWMELNNIDSDIVQDQLIDCIENGTDQWQYFLNFLETHSEDQLYDGTDD
ncbi:hypothetical protein 010DV004_259 [Bacillus phage 010DV004]|nr:hypothetical protein 010DV004_259 [Bacillus phage 010DV004]QZA69471.1 hypothetical protein 010DV005_259 [Bacillus phage 010DV005]QZA70042.1 hypothetical protein 043JT007_261 [Bacillus phage 043JT007]